MTVGLVVVSHSALLADGIAELCAPVAPHVVVATAGGGDDGGLGTSAAKVTEAARLADSGDGAVLLGDLGSALLTAEAVVELAGPEGARWRVTAAPLVGGAVAAAVAAEGGADLEAVLAAASGEPAAAPVAAGGDAAAADAEAVVELVNADGLHARPAAALVRLVARFEAAVRVDGVDARSLLQVIALGRVQGARVRVTATGPDARAAVDAVRSLVEGRFGEA